MVLFYTLPYWFFGYSIVLELLFGLVTALVAFYSFKVYALSSQRECNHLGWAFSAISASYLILPIIQLVVWSQLKASSATLTIGAFSVYALIAVYAHVFLLLIGLVTLVYLTFGKKNQRLYSLLVTLSLLVVVFSARVSLAFNFVAAVLLLYVLLYYVKKYWREHNEKVLLTLVAIAFLFIARVVFAFTEFNPVLYAVSHCIEFAGYALMMLSLMKTVRR